MDRASFQVQNNCPRWLYVFCQQWTRVNKKIWTTGGDWLVHMIPSLSGKCPFFIILIFMKNVLDSDILVSNFELKLHYYFHFQTNILGKDRIPLIPQIMNWIVPLLSFYKNGFGIKWYKKVDMPLNKKKNEKKKTPDSMQLVFAF